MIDNLERVVENVLRVKVVPSVKEQAFLATRVEYGDPYDHGFKIGLWDCEQDVLSVSSLHRVIVNDVAGFEIFCMTFGFGKYSRMNAFRLNRCQRMTFVVPEHMHPIMAAFLCRVLKKLGVKKGEILEKVARIFPCVLSVPDPLIDTAIY